MNVQMKHYVLLLIIHNVLCYNRVFNNWSKLKPNQWNECIKFHHLTFLNESIFDEYIPLYDFYLLIEKSSITTLLPNTFKNFLQVVGVILSDINIKTISPGVFNGTYNLAEIDLSKNKLTKVEDGVFNKVQNLGYLDLSDNYIQNVSELSFKGLRILGYLYLQGNRISFLQDNLFVSQVNSLLKLDVSSNGLREINQTFMGMNRLTHLSLKINNLSDREINSFQNLTSLVYLDISYTGIQHIRFPRLEKLSNLNISNNKLWYLNRDLFSAQKFMANLNISSNRLEEINTVFHGMSHLTHLYLQINNISTLAWHAFQNLSSLQDLDLSHNSIQDLHENIFSGCESIISLYLHDNKIIFLYPNLFDSPRQSLIILNLSLNNMREIGTAFRGMSHLTNFYLQENRIASTAADAFQGLTSLQYLDISFNALERFQYGLLDHLEQIRCLNFSSNKFEEFPINFLSYLLNLEELVFENNKIKSLNGIELVRHFTILEKIGISGNVNWTCKGLAAFVKELRFKKITILMGNYFSGHNIRGMRCYDGDIVSIAQDNDSKESKIGEKISNNEINSNYSDNNIKDFISVILEKRNSGNISVTILLAISTLALIVITFFQFSAVRIKRNVRNNEQVELL